MALVTCDFYSDVLEVSTSMTVVLPQQTRTQIGMPGRAAAGDPPVLYLLHGLSDDHTTWVRRTSIERYAAPLGLAVVMPAVHRSFYADEVHGHRYWTFLSEELPALVGSFFGVSGRAEQTWVAGLSMGGYGALKWAMRRPDRFAGAASLSGVVDLTRLSQRPDRDSLFNRVFGGEPPPEEDPRQLLATVDPAAVPPLHISCGTEDELMESNRDFVRLAEEAGLDVTAAFVPGAHDWGLWDRMIQRVLAWLPGLAKPSDEEA